MNLFISYRSLDSSLVDALVVRLRSLKSADGSPRYDVWQDKTHIPVGQDWWKAIVQGITACDVFVFMVSRRSVTNVNCRAELSYARKRNRPVIPLVLDGEFTYNPATGKNDIDFWEDVPDQLKDGRFQMLFYEGASFLDQINAAVAALQDLGLRDIPAPEPPDPRDANDATNDTGLIYDRACDYAWRLEFPNAEKLFQRLLAWRDPLFEDEAHQWIVILRQYEQMVRLDQRPNTRHKIPDLWRTYARQFPKSFTPLFDPKGFERRCGQTSAPRQRTADIMPPPFAWIDIPAGQVTLVARDYDQRQSYLKQTTTVNVSAFTIARYPVTNAQYALFVDAGGYQERRWWTDAGWEAREQGWYEDNKMWKPSGQPWTGPRYWRDPKWDGPDFPVAGLSWYEAVAYCRWLSETSGESITLPTEAQWQRAAQGDDGRAYPWGDQWDRRRCNSAVRVLGMAFNMKNRPTTPVRHFEGVGDSPFGVVDMVGNVWEWCLTDYDTGSNDIHDPASRRIARGGAWNNPYPLSFRCDFRGTNYLHYRYSWGLRLINNS